MSKKLIDLMYFDGLKDISLQVSIIMGIDGIIKVIRAESGKHSIQSYDLERFRGMTIAVDASIMIYQTVLATRKGGADLVNNKGSITSHLKGIMSKIKVFLSHNITPIFVFDGKAPELKEGTLEERREKRRKAEEELKKLGDTVGKDSEAYQKHFRNTFKPSEENITELKTMLDLMGIPYIAAPGEADVVCAWLANRKDPEGKKYAKIVCSDDSDILVFGAPYIAKEMCVFLKRGKQITIVSLDKTEKKMGLTHEQFINLCVMLGCDHNKNIPGCGPKKALELAKSQETLEDIIDLYKAKKREVQKKKKKTKIEESLLEFDLDHLRRVRDYFLNGTADLDAEGFEVSDEQRYRRQMQEDQLYDFLCYKHNFNTEDIEGEILELKRSYGTDVDRPNKGKYHKIISQKSLNRDQLSDSDSFNQSPVIKPATEEEPEKIRKVKGKKSEDAEKSVETKKIKKAKSKKVKSKHEKSEESEKIKKGKKAKHKSSAKRTVEK